MVIHVKVRNSVSKQDIFLSHGVYTVSLKRTPLRNRANFELIDFLSSYFNTSKSSVKILKGLKSKRKIVEILEE